MSFGNLFSVISSFVSAQIAPTTTSFFNGLWDLIGNAFTWLGNAIASLFYVVCKWFLAFVDFLQYFIQKLIGLDYWLNNNTYTLEGATGNDLLFSFLYDETVQRVFRAMLGVFVVLLIIFTIYQIIKNEWTYITGESFGDGKSNSKAKILRQALKAIAIVILFPIMLFVGIISSNAILASLVKALNIDMASTFGGSIFSISAQNANRYRQYAAADARNAVSDEVSFYITRDGKYLVLTNGRTGSDEFCEYVNTYEDYLNKAGSSTKYTVNTMFGQVNPNDPFYGYCVSLNINGETVYYMLPCLDYSSTGTVNSPTAMYYYLRNVLQVNIMNRNNNIGNQDILNDIRGYMQNGTSQNGFIRNADFSQFTNGSEVIKACYNSWSYGTIYSNSRSFSESLSFSGLLNGQGSFLSALGIDSVQSAKLMFNNDTVATYFDGGQLGVVQLKAEYQVMADVMDFILENGVTLYMLDISSNMINWTYDSNYQVETRWVSSGTLSGNVNNAYYDAADGNTYLPFVVSYSEECDDAEMGNVLYMANADGNNELYGSKYIMCWKVNVGTSTEYIPLVNNMTYTDPETRNTYRFSSDYLASNYRGVVLAKGAFDFSVNSTNAMGGMPTYIKSSQNLTNNEGEVISQIDRNTPYYYNMSVESGFTQFVDEEGLNGNNTTNYEAYTIDGFGIEDSGEGDSLDAGSSYSVSPISGNNRRFQIIKDSDPVTLNDALMQRLTVNLIYTSSGGNRNIVASFGDDNLALSNGANRYLLFEVSNNGYYFIIRYNTTDNYFTVHSVDTTSLAIDKQNNSISFDNAGVELGDTLNCAYWNYNIKYTTYEEGKKSEAINKIGADQTIEVNSSYFEYSQESDGGQSLYRTEEIINISSLNKSSYIFAYFNTVNQSLLNLNLNSNKIYINFATADPGGDYSSTFDQKVLRFDLYNFYTYMTSGSSLKVWNDDGTVDPATVPDENDPNYVFKCKINESDFYFATNDNSLGLYDGNEYVATIYKNIGQECATIDDLASVTTRILYDTNSYENVRTRNYYGSDGDAMNHYESLSSQFIIGNYRDNAPVVFWKWDFNLWLFGIRINCALGLPEMNREVLSQSFRVSDGIGYDYFFDNDTYISLSTFYIPLKISYWIILISSVLIIKVLGTAIWGVIKRFYEITLYYLAMPAMASTIPLDDGNRFNQHIIRNLFNKVLGTYGVILGINVFFILLTPVRSLSNIFTAEDIATSGSYFLIHLPFSYKVLNSYVYILFVLVAFTMIDSLPKVISALMGNENGDILTSGQRTKEQVGKDMKSATDMISGRSLIDSTKKAGQMAKDTVPGGAVFGAAAKKVKGAVEWGIQKHQGKKEAEAAAGATADGGSSGGTKSARADDENPDGAPDDSPDGAPDGTPDGGGVPANVTAENSPAMAPVNQAVENRTGVSVADAHASGDNASIAVADAAREEIGGELTDEQAEAIAASDVNRQAINNEEITGGDNAAVVANVVRNNADNANLARTVAQAVTNSQGSNPINLSELGLDASKLGLDGANITVGKDANGNLEYKATDEAGQEVTIPPDVISQITQAILAKLGNGDIKTAAMQSGEMGAVANIFGNNLAAGLDFSNKGENNVGTFTDAVYDQARHDENINADAYLRYLINNGGYDDFASSYHINDSNGEVVGKNDILNNKEAYARAIEVIKNNNLNNLNPESYRAELTESIEAGLKNGTFSVSAWSLQGEQSRQDATAKALASVDTQGHTILDGATEAEQTSIIANTARNIVASNPDSKFAREMQTAAFAGLATEENVKSMNPEMLKKVTGKGSYEELTDEDKALLGFMSLNNNGKLEGISDADVVRLKGMYNNGSVRAESFESIDSKKIKDVMDQSGHADLLARVATLDSSLALSKEQKEKFVKGLSQEEQDKIREMSGSSRENYINALIREKGTNFDDVVNSNYQKFNARTDDELAAERDLSQGIIDENRDDIIYNAFASAKFEGKSELVDELVANYAKGEKLDKSLAGELESFNRAGYSEQDVKIAQAKLKLLGENIDTDSIWKMLGDNGNSDTAVLQKLKSPEAVEELKKRLDPEQKQNLENIASTNGFAGLDAAGQSELLAKLASEDGDVIDKLGKAGIDITDTAAVNKFLNSAGNEELKARLTSRASEMSLYEVNERLAGKNSDEVYAAVQHRNEMNRLIDATVKGNNISAEDVHEQMILDNDTAAMAEFASEFSGKFSVIDAKEAQTIKNNAILSNRDKIIAALKEKYGDNFNSKFNLKDGNISDEDLLNIVHSEMQEDAVFKLDMNGIAETALQQENLSRLANGAFKRTTITAGKIRENSRLMKQAKEQFVRDNDGKEFDELSEIEQDQYLAQNFASKLSVDVVEDINNEYLDALGITEEQLTSNGFKSKADFLKQASKSSVDALLTEKGLLQRKTGDEAYSEIVKNMNEEEFSAAFNVVSENSDSSTIDGLKRGFAKRKLFEQGEEGFEKYAQNIEASKEDIEVLNQLMLSSGLSTMRNGKAVALTYDQLTAEQRKLLFSNASGEQVKLTDLSDEQLAENINKLKNSVSGFGSDEDPVEILKDPQKMQELTGKMVENDSTAAMISAAQGNYAFESELRRKFEMETGLSYNKYKNSDKVKAFLVENYDSIRAGLSKKDNDSIDEAYATKMLEGAVDKDGKAVNAADIVKKARLNRTSVDAIIASEGLTKDGKNLGDVIKDRETLTKQHNTLKALETDLGIDDSRKWKGLGSALTRPLRAVRRGASDLLHKAHEGVKYVTSGENWVRLGKRAKNGVKKVVTAAGDKVAYFGKQVIWERGIKRAGLNIGHGLKKAKDGVVNTAKTAWGGVLTGGKATLKGLQTAWGGVKTGLGGIKSFVTDSAKRKEMLHKAKQGVVSAASATWGAMKTVTGKAVGKVGKAVSTATSAVGTSFVRLGRGAKVFFTGSETKGARAERLADRAAIVEGNRERIQSTYSEGTTVARRGATSAKSVRNIRKSVREGMSASQVTEENVGAIVRDSVQPDTSRMSARERQLYNHNRNLLQQRIRTDRDNQILYNLFQNTSLLNQGNIIRDLLKLQTGTDSDRQAKFEILRNDPEFIKKVQEISGYKSGAAFDREFKNLAWQVPDSQLKKFIKPDVVGRYLRSNEQAKDQLLNLGAQNLTLTLNNNTLQENQMNAVLSSRSLQSQVANDLLTHNYGETQIKQMIRDMLAQEGNNFGSDEEFNKYFDSNKQSLINKLALQQYFSTDQFGRTTINNNNVNNNEFINAINRLSQNNELFRKTVYNSMTQNVAPNSHASEAQIDAFFGKTSLEETAHLHSKFNEGESVPQNAHDAFVKFTKDGFLTRGRNAILFKLTKKLPEQSAAYDNWNRLLENKIKLAKSKQGVYATMSDEHRLQEISKLESQKIKQVLPDDFYDMSLEDQRAFKEQQTKLKQEALQVKNYGRLYNEQVRVTRPQERGALKKIADRIGYSRVGGTLARVPGLRAVTGGLVTETVKLKHKQDLMHADQLVERFNASALLRNKEVNFGVNFEQFAKGYFTPSQVRSMMRRYGLASAADYSKLTGDNKSAELKKRENAFRSELERLQRVAAIKVAQDENVKPQTYLAARGFVPENVRYVDGSQRYTRVQSELTLHGRSSSFNIPARRKNAEAQLNSLRERNDRLQELNSTFKGSKEEYYNKLVEILGNDKGFVNRKIGSQNLPKSVLMRNALKFVENSERQYAKRLNSRGMISASSDASARFVGKTMTNAKTQREIELDQRRASDINRDLNTFRNQRDILSFDKLVEKLSPQLLGRFKAGYEVQLKKKDKDGNVVVESQYLRQFGNDEEKKKDFLERFIKQQLDQANSKVHNNNLLKSDASKLTKLNGIYLNKRDLNTTGTSGTVINNMHATNSAVYQNLVKNVASANSKYRIEEANLSELSKRLETLRSMPSTRENRSEIRKVMEAMAASRIKLGNLKQVASAAEARKTAYEKSFATTQIKEAKISNRNLGVNVSRSVFERYEFPMRRPGGGPPVMVNPGSMEGKIIDRLIIRFMLRYRNYMERMIKSFKETDKSLYDELNNSYKKLKSEFGSNYRSLKSTQKKLENKLNTIKNKTDKESLDMKTRISDNLTKLKQTETELTGQLKNMGVEIGEVRLKKQ